MYTVEKSTNCCLERLRMVFVIGTLDKYDDQEEVRPILRLSLLESACCRSGCSVGDQLNNWPADELSLTHNWANTHRESREGEEPFSSTRTQEEKEEYLSLEEDSSLFHSLSTFSPLLFKQLLFLLSGFCWCGSWYVTTSLFLHCGALLPSMCTDSMRKWGKGNFQ